MSRPKAARVPRITHAGETYLAARDVAITMVRAGTPVSEAWIDGFIDGVEAARVAIKAERQAAERVAGMARNERSGGLDRTRLMEEMAVRVAEQMGQTGEADE